MIRCDLTLSEVKEIEDSYNKLIMKDRCYEGKILDDDEREYYKKRLDYFAKCQIDNIVKG